MSEERNNDFNNVKSLLFDIEGTTTSITFVKDELFPYCKNNLTDYIEKNWGADSFSSDLKLLKEQSDRDKIEKAEGFIEIEDGDNEKTSLIKNVEWQMEMDRKSTALKQLQGHVWEKGYKCGDLKGHIYDDVAENLKKWSKDGRKLYVYSSGSIEAQKLLFANSTAGDLSDSFSGHFDTTTGPKVESKSYAAIAAAIDCPADQILFLTDIPKEAEAAKTAGFKTVIVVREGNAPLSEEELQNYHTIKSFDDLVLERSSKRIKTDTEEEEKTIVSESASVDEKKEEVEVMDVDVTSTNTKTDEETKETEKSTAEVDLVSSSDSNVAVKDNSLAEKEDVTTSKMEELKETVVDSSKCEQSKMEDEPVSESNEAKSDKEDDKPADAKCDVKSAVEEKSDVESTESDDKSTKTDAVETIDSSEKAAKEDIEKLAKEDNPTAESNSDEKSTEEDKPVASSETNEAAPAEDEKSATEPGEEKKGEKIVNGNIAENGKKEEKEPEEKGEDEPKINGAEKETGKSAKKVEVDSTSAPVTAE